MIFILCTLGLENPQHVLKMGENEKNWNLKSFFAFIEPI
jgi:hypothetical protein